MPDYRGATQLHGQRERTQASWPPGVLANGSLAPQRADPNATERVRVHVTPAAIRGHWPGQEPACAGHG